MGRSRIVSLLVVAGVLAAVLYLGWLFVAQWQSAPLLEAQRVPPGDQEIAWVHLATSTATWERFVDGVYNAQRALAQATPPLGLSIDDANAFPSQTSAVPELSLQVQGLSGCLRVRYYKLTSATDAGYWVRTLAARKPAPAAIIGGMSSDQARDLARALQDQRTWHGSPPVFVIATATADRVALRSAGENVLPGADVETEDLMHIYRERSFRFCFTNSQMAQAVTRFIWSEKDLRPAPGPIYLVSWKDDPYSRDLTKQFYDAIWPPPLPPLARGGTEGGSPHGGLVARGPPWKRLIPYSIGSYSRPNAREAEVADALINEQSQHPEQTRALLVLPAASQPARRFLRAMVQTAPMDVHRFVVATGDYIDFNSVCRDRDLAWPIQDLPIDLVFFSHRSPGMTDAGGPERQSSVDDMLLYADMAETLCRAAVASAQQGRDWKDVLAEAKGADGQRRFDSQGNLRPGGEFVNHLQPERNELGRVLPRATLRVYRRSADGNTWELVSTLQLNYSGRSLVDAERESP